MSAASEHPTHLLLHQDGVAWLYQLVGVLSDQGRHDLEAGGDRIEDVVPARSRDDRDEVIWRGGVALQRRWPTLGIVSRAPVYEHPTKLEIARTVLAAVLDDDMPPKPPAAKPSVALRVLDRIGRVLRA